MLWISQTRTADSSTRPWRIRTQTHYYGPTQRTAVDAAAHGQRRSFLTANSSFRSAISVIDAGLLAARLEKGRNGSEDPTPGAKRLQG